VGRGDETIRGVARVHYSAYRGLRRQSFDDWVRRADRIASDLAWMWEHPDSALPGEASEGFSEGEGVDAFRESAIDESHDNYQAYVSALIHRMIGHVVDAWEQDPPKVTWAEQHGMSGPAARRFLERTAGLMWVTVSRSIFGSEPVDEDAIVTSAEQREMLITVSTRVLDESGDEGLWMRYAEDALSSEPQPAQEEPGLGETDDHSSGTS